MVGAFVIADLHDSGSIAYLGDAADGRVPFPAAVFQAKAQLQP
jgi:hypothetical protein